MSNPTEAKLIAASRLRTSAAWDDIWRAAAADLLEACFSGAPSDIIRDFADVFGRIHHMRGRQA